MNARSSTGPRTAKGKRIVAGNASRHGATSATDPEVTERMLRIILDAPEPTLGDALIGGRRMQVALRLAAAEARALQTEIAARRSPIEAPKCTAQDTLLRRLLEVPSDTPELRGIATELLEGALQEQDARRTAFEREKRLARRYVSEARAELRKARAAWIELLVEERAPRTAESAAGDFPKQKSTPSGSHMIVKNLVPLPASGPPRAGTAHSHAKGPSLPTPDIVPPHS